MAIGDELGGPVATKRRRRQNGSSVGSEARAQTCSAATLTEALPVRRVPLPVGASTTGASSFTGEDELAAMLNLAERLSARCAATD